MKSLNLKSFLLIPAMALAMGSCTEQNREYACDNHIIIEQKGGATLGYSPNSGIRILEQDGFKFKDLNRNGVLDPYEDWRLDMKERAKDLASELSIDEIAGLMLYSNHQGIPATVRGRSTYNGLPFEKSGCQPWELSDAQKAFLKNDNVRHILITSVASPETAARWNNQMQAYVEGFGHGIPGNNSSDPRHSTTKDAEFNAGGGGQISIWPLALGLGATFDPELVQRFGEIAGDEYRALGFATALSPQVDIATEPRWFRFSGTFGEDPVLSADMARAYIDGFQTSEGDEVIADGWGYGSVNAMVKHWPGGGACEAGRDAHYGCGKYAVFPNDQIELHKYPFTQGAFKLSGPTVMAAGVMPYYTISYGQSKEAVGNSFNQDVITRQLRDEVGYDGVVCTDWRVTKDETHPGRHSGKPWGVETLSVVERHYKALKAGVDQFGGNNEKQPVIEAYEMGVKEFGAEKMRARMERSAYRLLMNIFRTGLFENPYLDPAATAQIVGCDEYDKAGYEAQVKSTVMLKNASGVLPLKKGLKVYVPQRHVPSYKPFFGEKTDAVDIDPIDEEDLDGRFERTENVEEADFAMVFISSPIVRNGYDMTDRKNGGNGYVPISLQYSDYTATTAREVSIAGGDPFEDFTNRSYKGKSTETVNKGDMILVRETRKSMGNKPVIVVINTLNPFILSEIEPYADAIFLTFDIDNKVVIDLVSGKYEPSALLPMQMPADMETVERQMEDTPGDMECYRDSEGHVYDFAYGLDWKGVINDARTARYSRKK